MIIVRDMRGKFLNMNEILKRNWLYRIHGQNLAAENKKANRLRRMWFMNWRAWIDIFPRFKKTVDEKGTQYDPLFKVKLQWKIGYTGGSGIAFEVGGHDECYQFRVYCPLFYFYFAVDDVWLPKSRFKETKYRDETILISKEAREIGISIYDGVLRLALWGKTDSWSSDDPRWQVTRWDFKDALLGKPKFESRLLDTYSVLIPLPEKSYHAKLEMREDTWRRRWTKSKITRAYIEIPGGIPIPGKGENSWDISDDAICGNCLPSDTPIQAIMDTAKSIMIRRERYGNNPEWNKIVQQ